MLVEEQNKSKGWLWVPSLYFVEGIPYIVVMAISAIMYKRLGISNTELALYTSWLYLPWVIKPFWSPIVDMYKTKRFWIIIMQLIIGAGLAGVAFTLPTTNFFQYTLAFLWLIAFSSATHDIAADGFYMLGLEKHQQAFFVGIRSTFYRLAMITGQGALIIFAGYFESSTGLDVVKVEVNSVINQEKTGLFSPNQLPVLQKDGDLELLVNNTTIEISTTNENELDIVKQVKDWNIEKGFYQLDEVKKKENPSFWTRNVSKPLADYLKSKFGENTSEITNSKEGNIGWVYFQLSKAPSEKIIVNFGSTSGDKSISLIEGTRFEFNDKNWNQPAIAVFQLDSKLTKKSSAIFTATSGNIPLAWSITFSLLAATLIIAFLYHKFCLPKPKSDSSIKVSAEKNPLKEFINTFILFFKKDKIIPIVLFLLLYRLGEAQLVKLASPFLLDSRELNGLGLTTGDVGIVYGTIGIIGLTLGGILGGWVVSKKGLKYWLWWMILAINLPNGAYIFLSTFTPDSFIVISTAVTIEQFGYGFGFTAYMLYMIYVSEGEHKTAHFAITTGFMALGMMIPGMFSGWLQEIIGYQRFFIWVLISAIPGFIAAYFIPLDANFGKKTDEN